MKICPSHFPHESFARIGSAGLMLSLLLAAGVAGAGDFCGTDCVLSEDFDDAVSGNADGVGTSCRVAG